MLNRQILYMNQTDDPVSSFQGIIMTIRRAQLSVGCVAMFFIIINICYKRLYVYNTTKLFMFCCICYLIGMAVVLPHNDSWNQDRSYFFANQTIAKPTLVNVLQEMKQSNRMTLCGLEALFNLYFYDLGYFFAVLVTYNVFCVINNNYHRFMRTVLKKPAIIAFLLFMVTVHLVPFILLHTTDNFNNYYAYSYGPTGFNYPYDDIRKPSLFLYCGISFNPSYQILAIANIYICPIIMLIIHSIILCTNQSKIKLFQQEQYLNSKQQFLLRSGQISLIVFIIQAINLIKLVLSLIFNSLTAIWLQWVIIIINFLFDLYPLVFLYFYLRFTKQRQGRQLLHGSSTLIDENQ